MIELEYMTLEDGLKYIIVDEISDGLNNYIYMSEENNENNFCIRKTMFEDNKEFIIPLNDEDEFKKALKLFNDKNNK